jgi:uncharacterized protein (DUF169 family)
VIPEYAESYGDDVSFECAMIAEVWGGREKPFCIVNKNVLCGGAVYSGIGNKKMTNEDFQVGMVSAIGPKKAYATLQVMRRVNQQLPHVYKPHKYLVIGRFQDVPDPDVIMVTADANRIHRLCKVYTWKTGELVHGVSGTAWCANSFPLVYRTKTMTFNMGDPPSRFMMQLDPGEMFCFIHYSLVPLIVENFDNISSGVVEM